jgi:hypothetical protein
VHHQAAGILLLPVPATEVVGAVPGVEHPLELDAGHGPDLAVRDQLSQGAVPRGVPVVEGDDNGLAGLGHRVDDLPGAVGVDRQRLLHDHVRAGPQQPGDDRRVRVVGARHDHPVDRLLLDHPLQVVGAVLRELRSAELANGPVVEREAARVRVEQRDQLCLLRVLLEDGADVRPRPRSGPGDCIASGHEGLLLLV